MTVQHIGRHYTYIAAIAIATESPFRDLRCNNVTKLLLHAPTLSISHSDAPGVVSGLSSSNTTSTSVALSWTSPVQVGNPRLSHYVISVNPAHISNSTSNSTYVTLTGLSATTSYVITVVAVSTLFPYGNTSTSLSVTTLGASCKIM